MQITTLHNGMLSASAPPETLVAPPAPNHGPDFASLLRHVKSAPSAPPPMPAPPPSGNVQPPAPHVAQRSGTPDAPPPAAAKSPAPRTPDKAKAASPPAAKTAAANAADDAAKPAAAERSDDAAPTGSADLSAWLAQLHAAAGPTDAGGAGDAAGGDLGGAQAARGKAGAELGAAADGALPASDANPAAFANVLAETSAGTRAADQRSSAIDGTSITVPASAASPAAEAGSRAGAPLPVAVATPVDSPDFPQALGMHLSLLAKDGVQHAELHLNPADMGPVSVQIVLDGTQAHIDFGADAAATRHAIEAGLPELATALRDAGLTLTGGGVSQHSRGQAGDARDGNASGGGGRSGPMAEPVAQAARRIVALGGVDLYA